MIPLVLTYSLALQLMSDMCELLDTPEAPLGKTVKVSEVVAEEVERREERADCFQNLPFHQ